jgi:DNA-binding GntR family transcriptional regulator
MTSGPDDVYAGLREALATGRFRPNEPLRERTLATEFNVSRTPIREALRKLTAEGFVQAEHGFGARVTALTAEDLSEVFAIRTVLEGLALRQACADPDPKLLKALEAVCKGSAKALRSGDRDTLVTLNVEFHVVLVDMAKSPRLSAMTGLLRDQTRRYGVLATFDQQAQQLSVKEHTKFLDLIRAGKVAECERLLALHLDHAKESLLQILLPQDDDAEDGPVRLCI